MFKFKIRKFNASEKLTHLSQVSVGLLAFVFLLGACATANKPKELSDDEQYTLYLQMGNATLSENDPTTALQWLLKAEAKKPDSAVVHHSLALAYYQKHLLAKALAEGKQAVTLDSDYSEANNTYGRLLIETNQLYPAISYLQKAAADPLYRDAFKAQTNLGIIFYRVKEFSRAKDAFAKATEISPQAACVAYYYRGHLALRESNFKEAATNYLKATQKVCSNFPDAHLALGIAYQDEHEFDLARKTYAELAKNYPNTPASEQALTRLKSLP
jgi:Tfp pilus assembly protein PilF